MNEHSSGNKKDWRFYCALPSIVITIFSIGLALFANSVGRLDYLQDSLSSFGIPWGVWLLVVLAYIFSVVCAISWIAFDENGKRRGTSEAYSPSNHAHPESLKENGFANSELVAEERQIPLVRKASILIVLVAVCIALPALVFGVKFVGGLLILLVVIVFPFSKLMDSWYGKGNW